MVRTKKNIPQLKDCECGNCNKKIWSFDKWGKYRIYYKGHFGPKTRKKISRALTGLMVGEKNPMYGKKLSDETKQKISEKVKGEKNPAYGRRLTEEQKMVISRANKGRIRTEEFRKKVGETMKGKFVGENNPSWKGENVSYGALHDYIKSKWPKPELCQMCNEAPAFDLACITGVYNRELKNWAYFCRKCHFKWDNIPERNFRKRWDRNKIKKNQTLQTFGF